MVEKILWETGERKAAHREKRRQQRRAGSGSQRGGARSGVTSDCDPRFPGIAGSFEMVAGLQVDRIVGGGIEVASQAQRGFPRDGALPGDYGADAVGRHAQLLGQAVHGHAKVVQGFLEDGARVDGWELSGSVW